MKHHSKYTDGFYNSMIDNKDGHIPSPLIMFTCTTLHHAFLEWQKIKGVPPKALESKFNVGSPQRSNNFNWMNNNGKTASRCARKGRKLLTSPDVADTVTLMVDTWNTPPESYQERVFKNTLATFKCQIQQAENPMPAKVIAMEAACVDNAILLEYFTPKVAGEQPEIRSTVPNIPIDNNCTHDELHFGYDRLHKEQR